MSVTSSTTTSGDQEVPSADIFWGRLCLISITRGDGTPMDASSISEEDIVEIFMKKGHTHPLGVLHYLTTESIILFGTMEEFKCASHGLVDIMQLSKWCHHAQDFGSFAGPYCLIYNSLVFEVHNRGWRATHSSPTNSPKWGNTASPPNGAWWPQWPWALTACRRPYSGDSTVWIICAPQQPPPNEWVCPLGSREPKEDDQEVTFPGGGRWGPLRQPTHVLEQPAGERVPSGPPQQPPCPVLAGPDMGQLITALTLGLQNRHP